MIIICFPKGEVDIGGVYTHAPTPVPIQPDRLRCCHTYVLSAGVGFDGPDAHHEPSMHTQVKSARPLV